MYLRGGQNKDERKRKSCVARLREEGRYAVSKIRRPGGIKMAIEDSERCNIPALRRRLKTVSYKRGIDKTKNL